MNDLIQTLLDITKKVMQTWEEAFFSRTFLAPKQSGGFRLVINLSQLNTSLANVTFQIDMLKKVKAFQPGILVT